MSWHRASRFHRDTLHTSNIGEVQQFVNRLMWNAYLAYHLRGQARFPFKPLEDIKRAQARRVQSIVSFAYRTVPYYRETMNRLGLCPGDFRTADDLARLPLLEREQLQRDPEYFISTAQILNRCLKLRSGGSTGAPCTVYYDTTALFQNAAHGERERSIITSLVGKTFGYRETVFAPPFSSAYEVQQFCRKRALFPPKVRIHRQYLSLLDSPEKTIRLLNDFRPDVVQSYGSYLEMLLAYLQARGESFHRPKVITYSSDGLSDSVKSMLENSFNIPVLSTYQAVEAFKIGFECQHHLGLHLNIDLYPVRIINATGGTLSVGESGDVIVSNLIDRATVLLNYRLGDIATILPDQCPCNRSLPLLSFLQGRSDDLIKSTSGQLVHPQAVRTIFTDEEAVWQYQVVQQTVTHFDVAIVAPETCDQRQVRERIAAKFFRTFAEDITVNISFVASIDRTAAGKSRPVISIRQRKQH